MFDPLPILAHGESYAQPVQKKTGGLISDLSRTH